MRNHSGKMLVLFVSLWFLAGNFVLAQEPPANVAGNWTIHSRGPDGRERTQVMEISQDGGRISGHYSGPGQEGELEGTINQQHILFRTKTHTVLTFRGRVDGPRFQGTVQGKTISGTYNDEHGKGEWNARHSD
jgi:hypothetical protein